MKDIIFQSAGTSEAVKYAAAELRQYGYEFCNENATHILLDIPTKQSLPYDAPNKTVIIGGNLQLPYPTIDLLQDPQYLAQNAMITAHCAVKVALNQTKHILPDQNILIIGWGRIGKCLAHLLQQIGCKVTVAARKEADRAMIKALGYQTIHTEDIIPEEFELIFNTVPELLIEDCQSPSTIIDLASKPGITGAGVISARGLPGKEAPASSGKLIAETVHRLLCRKEQNL